MATAVPEKPQIQLRLIVVEPLPGVAAAVQRGRSDLLPAAEATADQLMFRFPITVADLQAEPPRLTGEYAQGPAQKRFVYVNSGTLAGQRGTCWTRRAKIPLHGISTATLQQALEQPERVLEAAVSRKAKDGGPACASVPLLSPWTLKP